MLKIVIPYTKSRYMADRPGGGKIGRSSILTAGLVLIQVISILFAFSTDVEAVTAAPTPATVRQSDGSEVVIYLKGDENLHWSEDSTGYPVMISADRLNWVYAREEAGRLVPTGYIAGKVDPVSAGLVRPDMRKLKIEALKAEAALLQAEDDGSDEPLRAPKTGTMYNLVLLVNYTDLTISNTRQQFDDLFNQIGYTADGAAGSVRDYYDEVSYGTLTVQSTVIEPVTVSQGYAYYGANNVYGWDVRPRTMVTEALAALEARGFDFTTVDGDGDGWVDGLTVIHAGGGEEYSGNDPDYIWSHQGSLSSTVTYDGIRMRPYHTEPARRGWDSSPGTWGITRIGVICHETGHFIGLPDLYDYDYDSQGVGDFCLMAGGSWNGNSGSTPAHMSAWCKSYLEWTTPTLITGAGVYPLSQAETTTQVYKLQGGFSSNEYFLVENRQGVGFDAALPGTDRGVLIWHIDENQPNNDDQTHFLVDLEEASGTQHLELNQDSGTDEDYFRMGNATSFTAVTTPDNLSYGSVPLGLDIQGISATGSMMSFSVNGLVISMTSPTGGEIFPVGEVRQVSWTISGDTPDSISIYLSLDSGENYDYPLAGGLPGGSTSYSWTVSNFPVPTARLMVAAYIDDAMVSYDTMTEDFTIQGNPRRYVSPSGGNVYPYSIPAWAALTIQDAVDAADEGDSIMVAAATYNESVGVVKDVYLMGGWNSNFTERDTDLYTTTISSVGSPVSFVSVGSGNPGIEGFNIINGTGTSGLLPLNGIYGGGIFTYSSPAIIKDNTITGCGYISVTGFSAGGGISCYDGTVTISGNTITDCVAQSGGGIYLYQVTAAISGNTITGSSPDPEFSSTKSGGGIYALYSDLNMSGNVIAFNAGYRDGGGVFLDQSPMSSAGDSIYSNSATTNGGGIFGQRSDIDLSGAYLAENHASSTGGGIYQRASLFDMENSLVALNTSGVIGGGVYADSTWGAWENNTIDRNVSSILGGNVFLIQAVSMEVRGNMVTYGSPNGFQASSEDNLVFQYNDCYGNLPSDVVTVVPDTTNVSIDPQYADTTTMDYNLGLYSGGIDAGDPAAYDPDGSRSDIGMFGGPLALFSAPAYVQNLLASAVNDTTIELTWDSRLPGGLDFYAVYAGSEPGFIPGISNLIGTVSADQSSYQHHPVGDCYYYRVNLVDLSGYAGGYSSEASECAPGVDDVPPVVLLTSPNGGEVYAPGDTIDVTWVAEDNRQVDSISVYLSFNAGADFSMIAHGQPNDSLMKYVAPESASDSCIVRVVAYDGALLTGEDISDGFFSIEITTDAGDLPLIATVLRQNYPNPFNPVTTIVFSLSSPSDVSLNIYDVSGRLVRMLVNNRRDAGEHAEIWDGRDTGGSRVASGVYFYRLKAAGFMQTKKMVLLR